MSKRKQGGDTKPAKAGLATAFGRAAQIAGLDCEVGKDAMENRYRAWVEGKATKTRFTGSVDMDAAYKGREPAANRWDYGLGLSVAAGKEFAVWVEPHSASSLGEVKTFLAKLDWLQAKLKSDGFEQLKSLTDECHRQGRRPYHWMASSHVGIRPGSREANMLSQRGLSLPSTRIVV